VVLKYWKYRGVDPLPITYKVVNGDTFDNIARKKYGTETEAGRIAEANPGASEPLVVGTVLTIPTIPKAPSNIQQRTTANDPNEVALLINGNRFRYWDRVSITQTLDSISTINFGAPFESESPGFKKTFRPFSYNDIVVTMGGDPLFTGTMIGVNPNIDVTRKTIEVSGYSLPGVLGDCTIPASAFAGESNKLEFDNQGLIEIATTLAGLFGIDVEFQDDQGAIFERVALKPDETILKFLIKLAKQRNLIVSSTSTGKLLFLRPITISPPVAILRQGATPVLSVTPTFNPQKYFSHATGLETAIVGIGGSQFTVKNPHMDGVIRPFNFIVNDTLSADVKTTVEAKLGRMFGDIVGYSVQLTTWRDPLGNLWEAGKTVKLIAPDAMVYNEYEFIIRSVTFDRDSKSETAVLNLTFPESFSGEIPKVLPWDE